MTIRKFYGCDTETDKTVNDQHFAQNAAAFFNNGPSGINLRADEGQTMEQANDVFFGVEKKEKGLTLGKPIPGYSGTDQRVQADNIFGMTYANARKFAESSNQRIAAEKGDTLKQTAVFMPKYEEARALRNDY